METAHRIIGTIDLDDDQHLCICECGWVSPDVPGLHAARSAALVHVLLHRAATSLIPSDHHAA
jgi:hypothetical protein